ncbi:hypothetical protein BGV40_11040 [Methanosarcina sp. Ant1]|nr:hypothetical protein BGV40_11040 [Methanosarcina sp. Ant1]
MIHKDLYGQKKEIEKKTFLSYDNIPIETRQVVYTIITENVLESQTILGIVCTPSKGCIQNTDDYRKLWLEIKKYKRIPHIYDIDDYQEEIYRWLMRCSVVDFLRTIGLFIHIKKNETQHEPNERLRNTINDINDLFKLDKIGYEIVNEKIIRKDSEYLHEQVIKQTINLLYTNDFKGPLVEFQKALDHYIRKEYKDTIQEANNSFESTMKSILTKRNIAFKQDANADLLLDYLKENGVIYSYTKPLFQGLPKLRNNQSGHGQGIDPKEVNQSYAELALNLAGTFVVFLITRYQEIK